jgi:S1-C subfamily serine protease
VADESLHDILRELASQQSKVAEALEKSSRKEKDKWDKFAALSTFLSTVIIAAIGLIFTQVYNIKQNERNEALKQQEIRVAQIQTVERFIPYLTGTEEQKKIAILAINSLGNTDVATKLAALYPSEGTISALKVIARSGDEPQRKLANEALQKVFDRQRGAVVQLAEETVGKSIAPYASGIIVTPDGYIVTASYAVTAIASVVDTKKVRVITSDGTVHTMKIIDVDEKLGTALLKIDGSNYPTLQFGSPLVKPGDSVLAIGTKGKLALEPATGLVKSVDKQYVEIKFDIEVSGFGGGPVLSNDGLLIAMIYTGSAEKNDQCIRSDIIRTFLDKFKIGA